MAGGKLQLCVYGAQDMYLTANPKITFFKIVYRRHTNFSIETFERTFNDKPDFGKIGRVKIYRLGDLMTKMYLKVVINRVEPNEGAKFAWIRGNFLCILMNFLRNPGIWNPSKKHPWSQIALK